MLAGDDEDRDFRLGAGDGRVTIDERPEGPADAVVTGSEEAWVSALGPDGAIGSLHVEGKRGLAEKLLSGFTAAATGRGAQRAA